VLENAPAQPPGLEDFSAEYGFIQMKFLHSNITPVIQPLEQQVISNFKKLYTKALPKVLSGDFRNTANPPGLLRRSFQYTPLSEDYRQSLGPRFLRDDAILWTNLRPASVSARDLEKLEQNAAGWRKLCP
jgi:hypothetical protein